MATNFPDITKKNWGLSSGTAHLPSEKLQQGVSERTNTEVQYLNAHLQHSLLLQTALQIKQYIDKKLD